MDWIPHFVGRLHPLVVHLPIGIFLLLGFYEIFALIASQSVRFRLPGLTAEQRLFILALAAIASVVSAGVGFVLGADGGYEPALLDQHRIAGIATALLACALLAAARARRMRIYAGMLAALLVVLAGTSHLGGSLTHGRGYLTAGRGDEITAPPSTPENASTGSAPETVFAGVIQPILSQHCVSCHGPAKNKGDLRLDSLDGLLAGGKHGPALTPGDARASILAQRINLPLKRKGHMPPDGKPQLDDTEIGILDWWIDAGAFKDAVPAGVTLPPAVASLLHLPAAQELPDKGRLPDRATLLAAASELESSLRIVIRPLSGDGPWLYASARLQGKRFGDAELARLAAIAPAIQWLDLGGTAVSDAGLIALVTMQELHRLHLDHTCITDAGLRHLAGLEQLETLSLHHTGVTDDGLAALHGLTRLQSLYLWETGVTAAAARALADAGTDARKIRRWQSELVGIQDLIRRERLVVNVGEHLRPDAGIADASAIPSDPDTASEALEKK